MSVIISLDPLQKMSREEVIEWSLRIIRDTKDIVSGYKLGLPLLLRGGPEIFSVARRASDNRMIIADLKLADIGDIMTASIEYLADLGVNAVIIHSFTGLKDALDRVYEVCRSRDVKVIQIISMSHEGSREFIDKHVSEFIDIALRNNAWGVIAPATRREIIRTAREKLGGSIKILSPGVGAQGAEPGSALCAGADYEIIGRTITSSRDPRKTTLEILEKQEEVLRSCKT